MQNQFIQLVPADISLAEQAVDYYVRNKQFLEEFEPNGRQNSFPWTISEQFCGMKCVAAKNGQPSGSI